MEITQSPLLSLSEIRILIPEEKKRAAPLWENFVLRPLSYPLIWLALRLGITANQVTFLSAVCVIAALILAVIGGHQNFIASAVLLNAWALFDCVDGGIARARRKTGKAGEFIDSIAGYLAWGFAFIIAGLTASEHTAHLPVYLKGTNFILLAAITTACNFVIRILYQHYALIFQDTVYGKETSQRRWAGELGLTGIMMPALFLCAVTGWMHWFVLFYFAFYLAVLPIVIFKMLKGLLSAE